MGHERIAFLAGPSALFVARDRLAGYRRGLAEAGLAVDERLIVRTSFDREGGALGVDTLLAGDAPFTAMCSANDLLALGALGRLAEFGIRVPDEVSVAGFDDIGVAALTAPALSTVRMHLRELGRRGFAAVARVLDGAEAGHEELPIEVVLRASTGGAPADALSPSLRQRRHAMTVNVRGIVPACIVTLDADGRFDEPQLRRYIRWVLPKARWRWRSTPTPAKDHT